jgi:hypothetical protein
MAAATYTYLGCKNAKQEVNITSIINNLELKASGKIKALIWLCLNKNS